MGLQPKWCLPDCAKDDGSLNLHQEPPDDIEQVTGWDKIRKGSQNGFFLLLLTLGWWGLGASDQGAEELGRWAEAFDDLRCVLGFLLNKQVVHREDEDEEPLPITKR